uniref:Putative conserved plasma membrane protein n=1 Tax=Lutzomyia longipalpis TaxID=7200 RepID=A0A1B0CIY9_LUTLO
MFEEEIKEEIVVAAVAPEDLPAKGIDMDTITIIWYLSTFVALVAFFVVMACSDNYCGRPRKPEEPPTTAPPTPAPSYREFAPPSYDSVMKRYKNRVFIIPVSDSSTDQATQVQEVVVHASDDTAPEVASQDATRQEVVATVETSQTQVERF